MNAERLPPVIFLMGPTGAGKTTLAVQLCQQLPLDIVSVDSAMVYRGMDIGTAKPAAKVLRQAPHRLIDICDPAETYSAARFRRDALTEIADIHAHGRIPLLVGGTGLYFRSLEQGMTELPGADSAVRMRIEAEAESKGWEILHARLARVDPGAAARIHPHDPQRIQRALEVYELTGRPMTELLTQNLRRPPPFSIIKISLRPSDRGYLHERLGRRFLDMLESGLIGEVQELRARGDLHPALPAMRLVGYRQVWRYLEGQLDYAEMAERAIAATRQLARRQLTWLRRERRVCVFDCLDDRLPDKVLKFLAEHRNMVNSVI